MLAESGEEQQNVQNSDDDVSTYGFGSRSFNIINILTGKISLTFK